MKKAIALNGKYFSLLNKNGKRYVYKAVGITHNCAEPIIKCIVVGYKGNLSHISEYYFSMNKLIEQEIKVIGSELPHLLYEESRHG